MIVSLRKSSTNKKGARLAIVTEWVTGRAFLFIKAGCEERKGVGVRQIESSREATKQQASQERGRSTRGKRKVVRHGFF